MAYDDYSPEADIAPTDLAAQMVGQAAGLPEQVFGSALRGRAAIHMMRQSMALGFSIPKGEFAYKGLPSHMGLHTILGKRTADLGSNKLSITGNGMRGVGAGLLLGTALGVNPLMAAGFMGAMSVLPRAIGGSRITHTGIAGFMQLANLKTDWIDSITGGKTFGKQATGDLANRSYDYAMRSKSAGAFISRVHGGYPGNVVRNNPIQNLYRNMAAGATMAEKTMAGRHMFDLADVVATGGVSSKTAIDSLLADMNAKRKTGIMTDIGDLFTGGSAGRLKGFMAGSGVISQQAADAGFAAASVSTKGARLAAAGRLGVRGAGIAGAAGIAYVGVSALASQVYRGSQVLRDNLRNMNTALRLTEFGGRGSFMNDVVNTERDRAISAMQFVRSGRDFIGLEARLLAEGFSG